jgi:hypothetical protein
MKAAPEQTYPVKLCTKRFNLSLADIICDVTKGDFPHPNTMSCKLSEDACARNANGGANETAENIGLCLCLNYRACEGFSDKFGHRNCVILRESAIRQF